MLTRRPARAALPIAACLGLLLLSGCPTKKVVTVPPQGEAPAASTPETRPAPAAPASQPSSTQANPAAQPESAPPAAPKAQPKPRHHAKKPAAPPAQPAAPDAPAGRTVVREGSTAPSSSQLTPSLTPEEATRTRENTNQLLAATDANLRGLGRQLNREEQNMVSEARSYMAQAQQALTENDLVRAYNLAVKAHTLSLALVEPK